MTRIVPTIQPEPQVSFLQFVDVIEYVLEKVNDLPWPATALSAIVPFAENEDGTGPTVGGCEVIARVDGRLFLVEDHVATEIDPTRIDELRKGGLDA